MDDDLRKNIINFDPSNSKLSVSNEAKSLYELIEDKRTKDEFDRIFGIEKKSDPYQYLHLELDKKTKYLHNQGYYVTSFNPKEVFVSDGNIIYKQIDKMGANREELIKSNVFAQTVLMIAVYMDVTSLNTQFVKENFDSFSTFIPEEDQGYFAGVIERGSNIYYSDFTKFRDEKELEKYQQELEGESPQVTTNTKGTPSLSNQSKTLTKATAAGKLFAEQEEIPKAAFISVYLYALLTMVGFVVGVIYLFANLLK